MQKCDNSCPAASGYHAGAVSAHDVTAAHSRRRVPAVHDGHLRVVGVTAVLVAVAMVGGAALSGSSMRLAGGIRVDGVNVGGLTPRAATSLLERRSAQLADVPVTFVSGGQRFAIRPDELGVSPDWARAVQTAQSAGNEVAIIQGFRRLELGLFGMNVEPPAHAYLAAVDYEVDLLAEKIDRPVRQARLVHRGLIFAVRPGRDGQELDRSRAAAMIVSALASLSRSGPVELPVSVDRSTVSAAELATARTRAEIAVSAPVTLAVAGRQIVLTPTELAPMLTFQSSTSGGLVLGGHAADAYFAHLQLVTGRSAHGAHFAATGDRVRIVPAQSGLALDVPRSAAAVLAAAERVHERVARLLVETFHAGRTTAAAQALGITGLVGSYETVYGGVPNRIHNVELVAHLINGKLIAPGATFSFNQTTGARTAAKGFLVAPVIINGEVSTGLGGGVCQVSTTVFNAAFVAGLPITARTNHALYISHYPLGRDATVDYPDIDLRFVNDSPHWLLLRTFVGPSSLVVTLYGTPQHRRVVTHTTPLTATGPMPIAPRLDDSLSPGERVIIDPGMPPTSTSVERWVYAPDGKLLSDAIWYSNYQAVPEIVLVGPRRPPQTTTPRTTLRTTTPNTRSAPTASTPNTVSTATATAPTSTPTIPTAASTTPLTAATATTAPAAPTAAIPSTTTAVATNQVATTQVATTQVATTQVATTAGGTTQVATTAGGTTRVATTASGTTQVATTAGGTTAGATTAGATTAVATTPDGATQDATTKPRTETAPTTPAAATTPTASSLTSANPLKSPYSL